jgi:hypothetical protein
MILLKVKWRLLLMGLVELMNAEEKARWKWAGGY